MLLCVYVREGKSKKMCLPLDGGEVCDHALERSFRSPRTTCNKILSIQMSCTYFEESSLLPEKLFFSSMVPLLKAKAIF